MIEHPDQAVDVGRAGHVRKRRPPQHDDRNAEAARRRDLSVGGRAAAVLADDRIDAVAAEELKFSCFRKRPARDDVGRMGKGERRLDRSTLRIR